MSRILAPRWWVSNLRQVPLSKIPTALASTSLRSFGRRAVTAPTTLQLSNSLLMSRSMSAAIITRPAPTPSASLIGFFTSRRLGSAATTVTGSSEHPSTGTGEKDAAEEPIETPTLATPTVGHWLIGCAGLVFTIVVVGGITRLTESGLSITEWRPITGILPPLNETDWEEEFAKYKATPEFKMYANYSSVSHHN